LLDLARQADPLRLLLTRPALDGRLTVVEAEEEDGRVREAGCLLAPSGLGGDQRFLHVTPDASSHATPRQRFFAPLLPSVAESVVATGL
jgi:hypothetical protein